MLKKKLIPYLILAAGSFTPLCAQPAGANTTYVAPSGVNAPSWTPNVDEHQQCYYDSNLGAYYCFYPRYNTYYYSYPNGTYFYPYDSHGGWWYGSGRGWGWGGWGGRGAHWDRHGGSWGGHGGHSWSGHSGGHGGGHGGHGGGHGGGHH